MRSLPLLLALGVAACGAPDAPPAPDAVPSDAPALAPDLVVPTAEEAVRLQDHRGRVLVMQLAAADAPAWEALADAALDLETEGAALLGIVTEGRVDAASLPYPVRHADDLGWARALGFTGEPLTLVVGPSGRLRGQGADATADEIVMLAAPVLLEQEPAPAPAAPEALTVAAVERMVRGGAALIDVRPEGAPLADAFAVPLARLAPELLPLDLGTPIVFVGPDAAEAAARAAGWGHLETHAFPDPTGLEIAAPIDERPAYDPRDDLPRVRG